ncbi:MAG: stage II sporulation protein M [Myxococcales bacterium]
MSAIDPARETWQERMRAVGSLWLCWLVVYLLSESVLYLLVARGAALAQDLSLAADSTVAAASGPILEKLSAAAAPLTLQIGLVNTLALLVCFSLMPLMRAMADPKPRGHRAERLDRLMWTSPLLRWTNYFAYVLWPMPTFRRTPTLRLKGLCAFGVLPYLLPVLLGLQAGFVGGGHTQADRLEHPVAVVLLGLSLVLPHGLLELTGLFIPIAALLQYYRAIQPKLVAGDLDGVSAALHEHGTWREARRWLPLTLVLVAVAAVIEANLTLPFADRVASLLGLAPRG